jgi:hypothetical protein
MIQNPSKWPEALCVYNFHHNASVGVATDYKSGGWGSIPGKYKSVCSTACYSDRLWGPPTHLLNMYRELFIGVKRPGRETVHSPPFSAVVKNGSRDISLFSQTQS